MKLPPIRYPLPTLAVLSVLILLAWQGAALTEPLRSALASRWERAVSGPPVPSSSAPQVVAGPIRRRVLLLHDETAASDRPGGAAIETIHLRMFADVYDVWPLSGTPTHYRIGNRRAIGWVAANDVLPWDIRLVVRVPGGRLALADAPDKSAGAAVEVGDRPLPVVAWTEGAVQVAVWDQAAPWSEVARRGWVRIADLPADSWGVLLSRVELLTLLRESSSAQDPNAAKVVRLRAVSGRLSDDVPIARDDFEAARSALPAVVFDHAALAATARGDLLARLNEQWSPDASWGGLTFQFVPLSALP